MRLARLPALFAAAALVAGACSSAGSTSAPTAAATAAPTAAPSAAQSAAATDGAVSIIDFAFGPETLTITPGKVTWTHAGEAPHTVTFDDASITSSETLNRGGTFSATFAAAGTYAYKCAIHPSMKGKVTVK